MGTKRTGTRMCVISSLPEILVLHLKRYKQDSRRLSKDNTRVSFPMTLNLHSTHYELIGIVEHCGALNSGHYTAVVKSSNDNTTWYYCSDSLIKKTVNITT